MHCQNCGKQIKNNSAYCVHCGNPVNIESNPSLITIEETPGEPERKNKNFKIFLTLILSVVFIIICGLLAFFIINNLNSASQIADEKHTEKAITADVSSTGIFLEPENAAADSVSTTQTINKIIPEDELGPDQQRILVMFGYPDAFTVIFDEGNNNARIDSWAYKDIESCYIFEDGIYSDYVDYIIEEPVAPKYKVKPQQFFYPMKPSDVELLTGEKGTESMDDIAGLKVIIFGNGELICIFNPDDILIIANRNTLKST